MQSSSTEVAIEFSVRLDDGTVVESNLNKQPLRITLGQREVLPALEEAIKAMAPGESKELKLLPEQAYGPLSPDDFFTVDLTSIPAAKRAVGEEVTVENEDGERFMARVHDINGQSVTLDFNHPLAGKTLIIEVKRCPA